MSDFKVIYEDLPTTIGGFVQETDGYFTIVLNSRKAYDDNLKTYAEELYHIEHDDLHSDRRVDRIERESHRRRS